MKVGEGIALATWRSGLYLRSGHLLLRELPGTQKPTGRVMGLLAGKLNLCEAALPCPRPRRVSRACLPVPSRPFIKWKENGRANISRSSSSTSSFSSAAGEGEALEECDSGVGVALANAGEWGGHPGPSQTPALCIKIATVGTAPSRLCR